VPLLLRSIKASSPFGMFLQTKETTVRQDPGRNFTNDLDWTKVCGIHKSVSLRKAIVKLGLIVGLKHLQHLCVVKLCNEM
jgi:hypothetical protein